MLVEGKILIMTLDDKMVTDKLVALAELLFLKAYHNNIKINKELTLK